MNDALERLIEAVKDGTLTGDNPDVYPLGMAELIEAAGIGDWEDVALACDGSLDAADRLHRSLLPLMIATLSMRSGVAHQASVRHQGAAPVYGISSNPARAWLLAILRAKLMEAE